MRRLSVVLLAVALVLTSTMASAQAAKKKYVVTLTAPSTGEVGKALTLSGTAGPNANGKRVLVQRRAGSTWVTIARPLVRKGKWSTSTRPTSAGATSYRAIKPRSAKRKQGTSSTRTVKVYRWLWVAQQPAYASAAMVVDTPSTVAGVTYPHSLLVNEAYFFVKLGGLCTQAQTGFGFDVSNTQLTPSADFFISATTPFPDPPPTTPVADGVLTSQTLQTAGRQFLGLGVWHAVAAERVALTSPRAYCAANALPAFTISELEAALN